MEHYLKVEHCKEVLDREIMIGACVRDDGKLKRFTWNTWMNEYTVWLDKEKIDSGQAVEELLNVYNDLGV